MWLLNGGIDLKISFIIRIFLCLNMFPFLTNVLLSLAKFIDECHQVFYSNQVYWSSNSFGDCLNNKV